MLHNLINTWKAFSVSCWLWKHFPCKKVELLEVVVVGWGEVRWIWWMRQNFIAQFIHLLKHWLCDVEELGTFYWPVLAAGIAVFSASAQLIDLLRIFLRRSSFAGIWKAVVDQTTKHWPWLFFLVQAWLWKVLWSFSVQPLSWSSPVDM